MSARRRFLNFSGWKMSPHSPSRRSAPISGVRKAMASRTSSSRSEAMTIFFGLSSRAASRATCRPTIPAPPRMRIVSSANPLLLAFRQVPTLRDALVRQPALAVERGHAAGTGRGDGLPVNVVDGVAAGEDALDVRHGGMVMRQDDIALLVELDLSFVDGGVRRVADGDEEALRREVVDFVRLEVADLERRDAALFRADDFVDGAVVAELDFRIRQRALLHDLRRAQGLAAVDDRHLRGKLRQERRLLHRRVAAADDRDLFAAEEESVAGRAVGDAETLQLFLRGEAALHGRGAGGDDQRVALEDVLVGGDLERMGAEVDALDLLHLEDGAEALGLLAHEVHELRPEDSFGEAGVVFNVRGDGELPARLQSFEDERSEVGAGEVDRGGASGRAGADDDHAVIGDAVHGGAHCIARRHGVRVSGSTGNRRGWCARPTRRRTIRRLRREARPRPDCTSYTSPRASRRSSFPTLPTCRRRSRWWDQPGWGWSRNRCSTSCRPCTAAERGRMAHTRRRRVAMRRRARNG